MRVKIGPYKNWVGPYQLADMIFFWIKKYPEDDSIESRWDYRLHDRFGTWLASTWVNDACQWIDSKKNRKIKVHIDRWDTWSMDHTLAHIILPMLKQLKSTKHGSPYVDDVDLPKELRLTKREKLINERGYWDKKLKATKEEIDAASEKFHAQWDWVLSQMIWSFEQELDEDEGHKHYYDAYEPNEPTEPPMSIGVIDKDGNVTGEKTFSWDTEESRRQRGKLNMEKRKAYEERKQLGFTLFGKYYQALWD